VDRSYAVRQAVRRSIGTILWGTAGMLVAVGIGALLLWSWPDLGHPGWLRAGAILLLAAMALLVAALAYLVVTTAVDGFGPRLVFAVDDRGLTFGRQRLAGPQRFIPWSEVVRVRTYTLSRRPAGGAHGPPSHLSYLQVDLADGSSDRRSAPDSPFDWRPLADAVELVAPRVPQTHDGVLPEGEDPVRR
jgi:hypothetical protein